MTRIDKILFLVVGFILGFAVHSTYSDQQQVKAAKQVEVYKCVSMVLSQYKTTAVPDTQDIIMMIDDMCRIVADNEVTLEKKGSN